MRAKSANERRSLSGVAFFLFTRRALLKISAFGRTIELRATLANPDQTLIDFFGRGSRTTSGTKVDEITALRYSAVWACVLVLSQSLATLPLKVYRRSADGGKEIAFDHWAYDLLHSRPHPELTSYNWRSVAQGHVTTWGNSYSRIVTDARGRVTDIWPLLPDRMRVIRSNGRKFYKYDKDRNGQPETLDESEVLHIPGFGYNGETGYSVIGLHREAVGLGLSTEEFGARFFGNGTHPGAVLENVGKMKDEAFKRLKEQMTEKYAGLGKAHKLLVLEEGMKLSPIGIPPEDAQFLETRKFQRNEIASIFRVPPHMIADLEKATFSNIEQQSIDFVTNTLQPWVTLWEQELDRQILTDVDRENGIFIEFSLAGLLRGDIKARYESYAIARQNGWLSANEIRTLENMNPIEGGDEYLIPMNMTLASDIDGGDNSTRAKFIPLISRRSQGELEKRARQTRSITNRKRLERAHLKIFRRAAAAIINRETKAVARAAKKHLEERAESDFRGFLEEFYIELPQHIKREFSPTFEAYSELIQAEAAKEAGGEIGMTDDLRAFVDSYVEAFSLRWVSSSRGQLEAILDDTEPENTLAAIDERLEEWGDKRADKVAKNEVVRSAGAVVVASYIGAGVTLKRWVTVGDNCPFCDSLDGMIVDVEKNFVEAGDSLEGQGRDGPLVVRGNHMHPPIHQGCDCQIIAE